MSLRPWRAYGCTPYQWLRRRILCLLGKHRGHYTTIGFVCTWCDRAFDYDGDPL